MQLCICFLSLIFEYISICYTLLWMDKSCCKKSLSPKSSWAQREDNHLFLLEIFVVLLLVMFLNVCKQVRLWRQAGFSLSPSSDFLVVSSSTCFFKWPQSFFKHIRYFPACWHSGCFISSKEVFYIKSRGNCWKQLLRLGLALPLIFFLVMEDPSGPSTKGCGFMWTLSSCLEVAVSPWKYNN